MLPFAAAVAIIVPKEEEKEEDKKLACWAIIAAPTAFPMPGPRIRQETGSTPLTPTHGIDVVVRRREEEGPSLAAGEDAGEPCNRGDEDEGDADDGAASAWSLLLLLLLVAAFAASPLGPAPLTLMRNDEAKAEEEAT